MTALRQSSAAKAPAPEFSDHGSLREDFGDHGRAHVDRPLPFLVLHRFDPELLASLALDIAKTSPAYVIWPAADNPAAATMIGAVIAEERRRFAELLLIIVRDLPRPDQTAEDKPKLPPFVARIGASPDAPAQAAALRLQSAMEALEIDLRHCKIGEIAPLEASPETAGLAAHFPGCSILTLDVPYIHLTPDGRNIYPQLFHDLQVGILDALLKAACAFMEAGKLDAPMHYRALGRSSFIEAARSADNKLDRLCAKYDFLMAVSPINSSQALADFIASGHEKKPEFRYRPLDVDPDEAKRELFRIDLKNVEDPTLESLFSEKRHEIDHQLTMMSCRNSDRFRYASLMLYEPVSSALLDTAMEILGSGAKPILEQRRPPADCHVVAAAAQAMAARYQTLDPAFDIRVEIREDVTAGMLVSANRLYVSHDILVPAHRVEPLLHHEVGIHLLTYINGSKQGLNIFKRGLAGYEGVQEGLGVFAEWAVGGLTGARLRLLAARTLAVHAMTDGASFIDVFRLLHAKHHFSVSGAFGLTTRVFRSGGFAKDAIYLRGFKTILDLLAQGHSLEPYWYGKIAPQHVPVVNELSDRGILVQPGLRPEFFNSEQATTRIAAFRAAPSFTTLI